MNDLRGGFNESMRVLRLARPDDGSRGRISPVNTPPASPNLCPTMGEPAGPVASHDDVERSRIADVQGVSGRVAPYSLATPGTITAVIGNVIGGIVLFATAFAFVALLGAALNAI